MNETWNTSECLRTRPEEGSIIVLSEADYVSQRGLNINAKSNALEHIWKHFRLNTSKLFLNTGQNIKPLYQPFDSVLQNRSSWISPMTFLTYIYIYLLRIPLFSINYCWLFKGVFVACPNGTMLQMFSHPHWGKKKVGFETILTSIASKCTYKNREMTNNTLN